MDERLAELLGRPLVEHVRDAAIMNHDGMLQAHSNAPEARRWRQLAAEGDWRRLAESLIEHTVDGTISYLLEAIDHANLRLELVTEEGERIDLHESAFGELSGEYLMEWRQRFTKERCADLLAGTGLSET